MHLSVKRQMVLPWPANGSIPDCHLPIIPVSFVFTILTCPQYRFIINLNEMRSCKRMTLTAAFMSKYIYLMILTLTPQSFYYSWTVNSGEVSLDVKHISSESYLAFVAYSPLVIVSGTNFFRLENLRLLPRMPWSANRTKVTPKASKPVTPSISTILSKSVCKPGNSPLYSS